MVKDSLCFASLLSFEISLTISTLFVMIAFASRNDLVTITKKAFLCYCTLTKMISVVILHININNSSFWWEMLKTMHIKQSKA